MTAIYIDYLNALDSEALAMTAEPGGFLAVLFSDQAFRQDEALLNAFAGAGDRTALGQVLAQRGRPVGELVEELVSATERAATNLAAAIDDATHPDVRLALGSLRP